MLKKFAKGLLDKEVVPHSDNQLPIERLLQSSYSSYEPLSTPSHFSKQENAIEEKEEDLSEPEVFIGENTVIKGFLSFHTLLRIDGTFEGELSSKGKRKYRSTRSLYCRKSRRQYHRFRESVFARASGRSREYYSPASQRR
jgi:hypothetical protein